MPGSRCSVFSKPSFKTAINRSLAMTAATSYRTEEGAGEIARAPSLPQREPGGIDQSLIVTIVQGALRALWFGVIPALLAGVIFRYLVPAPLGSEGWLHVVANAGNQYPVPFAFA